MNRILLLLFLTAFSAFAQVPPVLRNKFSTNDDVKPVVGTFVVTNAVVNGGWISFDSSGLGVFDKNGQEMGRIFTLNASGIAMEYGGAFSGLFTNGTAVIHTRDGTKIPLSIIGDVTSQTTFLIAAYTNSGAAQNVFTVDSGGKIYSYSLLSSRGLYTDNSSNIISASVAAITYAANTNTLNFGASTQPYFTTTITNDTVFTNQNQQAGRALSVKLTGNVTNCNLSFPAAWTFIGSTPPASLGSNKVAILSTTAYGVNPSDIVAVYAVQP